MARTRATAVSAMVLALGLTCAGVAPFVGQSASATALTPVEPCDAGEVCEEGPPETTVTVITTLPTPTPTEQPETTVTKTVTATPTPKKTTAKPTPTKTTQAPDPTPQTSSAPQPQPLPTQSVEVPAATPSETESEVEMPQVATSDPLPSETLPQSSESEPIPLEVRNAAPEFDQRTLTQQLSIPALVMVLLVLFAVLIFEGRLRRMAHAAAVRKAGPQLPPVPPEMAGYPAGPGYATAAFPAPGYPGGTAYAPIISFVPVQTYPGGQVQYGAVYQDPAMYGQAAPEHQQPATVQEPVVLQPDQFDTVDQEPAYRAPFEPLVPPEPPPSDIPPGGAGPYEDTPERPLGAASMAEQGDAEPWQAFAADRTVVQPLPGTPAEDTSGDGATVEEPRPEQGKRKRGLRRKSK
ncbi:hypothetical protein [Nonomuraea ceibae]|uniref:hypothetical protein n=1 Tax=Nonomuraea ceibae TaxID=1935170 RepID=UPI001C5DA4C2|nr:hypothetical protein [Nonomuraea ceibae]